MLHLFESRSNVDKWILDVKCLKTLCKLKINLIVVNIFVLREFPKKLARVKYLVFFKISYTILLCNLKHI